MNPKWTLVVLLSLLLYACSQGPRLTLPAAQQAPAGVEQENDVRIQLWSEKGKVRMDFEGIESDIADFDSSMKAYFKGKSAQTLLDPRYFLRIDQAVPFGEYQQLQYWMGRMKINKHYLVVRTEDGEGSFEIYNPPLDSRADRHFCEQYAGSFSPASKMAELGLDGEPSDEFLFEPIGLNIYPALFDTALEQPIHLQMDAEGKCRREGRLLSSDELNTLLATHPGGPQVEPYFQVEIADAMPLEHYIPILEMLHTHHNDYLVLSSSHVAILKQIYLPSERVKHSLP